MFEETCGRLADSWLQKGVIQGRAEGRAEGWKDGRAEGWKDGKAEVALSMLEGGVSIDQITRFTGLSATEIEGLRKLQ